MLWSSWSFATFSPSLPPWLNTDKPYWNEFLPVAIILLLITIATILIISFGDPTRKTFATFKKRIDKLEAETRGLRSELELISKSKDDNGVQSK